MDSNSMQEQNYPRYSQTGISPEYAPISMWGYFGYELLFAIPCVGFILLIVLSFTASNVNLKNFARSYFCFLIIILIIIAVIGGATGLFATISSLVN